MAFTLSQFTNFSLLEPVLAESCLNFVGRLLIPTHQSFCKALHCLLNPPFMMITSLPAQSLFAFFQLLTRGFCHNIVLILPTAQNLITVSKITKNQFDASAIIFENLAQ